MKKSEEHAIVTEAIKDAIEFALIVACIIILAFSAGLKNGIKLDIINILCMITSFGAVIIISLTVREMRYAKRKDKVFLLFGIVYHSVFLCIFIIVLMLRL